MVHFNRATFNRKSSSIIKPTGNSNIKISVVKAKYKINKHIINKIRADIKITSKGQYIVIKKAVKTYSELNVLIVKATGTKLISATGKSNITFNAKAIGNIYGEEYLELKNLNLKPGEEIIIDMCDLTVTKNGMNAIDLIEIDSDFFDFFPNINEITIKADMSKLAINTFWKDRWL